MRHSVRMEKGILYTAAVLLCLVLASFWLMSNIYARYSSTASGSDSARVAIFGHDQSISLTNENGMTGLKPGDSRTYTVKVANYKGEIVSEVALKYNLEIVTAGNLPLKYTISKDGKEIGFYEETSDDVKRTITNDDMKFSAGTKNEENYAIQISWPSDKNDASYAGIPDDITLNINVEQID